MRTKHDRSKAARCQRKTWRNLFFWRRARELRGVSRQPASYLSEDAVPTYVAPRNYDKLCLRVRTVVRVPRGILRLRANSAGAPGYSAGAPSRQIAYSYGLHRLETNRNSVYPQKGRTPTTCTPPRTEYYMISDVCLHSYEPRRKKTKQKTQP